MESDTALREAMDRGISAAVEMAATILQDEALKGNMTAVIFFLKTKGGFHTPKVPDVVVPPPSGSGSDPAPISLDHIRGMAARQAALFVEREPAENPKVAEPVGAADK